MHTGNCGSSGLACDYKRNHILTSLSMLFVVEIACNCSAGQCKENIFTGANIFVRVTYLA